MVRTEQAEAQVAALMSELAAAKQKVFFEHAH